MHSQAFGFISRMVFGTAHLAPLREMFGQSPPPLGVRRAVVELGSLDINGSVRQLFMGSNYVGVDRQEGPGVDIVADGATYEPPFTPDTVVCCEVLEHAENARELLANAHRMLMPGGVLLVTCATDPRAPHSAVDGGELVEDEFYHNVSETELLEWLEPFEAVITDSDTNPGDLYAIAWKEIPEEEEPCQMPSAAPSVTGPSSPSTDQSAPPAEPTPSEKRPSSKTSGKRQSRLKSNPNGKGKT